MGDEAAVTSASVSYERVKRGICMSPMGRRRMYVNSISMRKSCRSNRHAIQLTTGCVSAGHERPAAQRRLPSGLAKFHAHHLDLSVYTAAIDRHFKDHGCMVPGLGDAGDRLFGTKWRWLLRQGCAMASTWMRRSTFILKP